MSDLKTACITMILSVAFCTAVGAAPEPNFCAQPVDAATVIFGAGPPPSHQLDPDEVTIAEGGTVTFNVQGGGHFISIYPVSLNTERADIEASLLQADNTGCVDSDTPCTVNSQYLVTDGTGHLVLDTGHNPSFNRVNVAAGAPSTPLPPSTTVLHTFPMKGKYLILCTNRGHFIPTPYMFGFVNVVRCGHNQ